MSSPEQNETTQNMNLTNPNNQIFVPVQVAPVYRPAQPVQVMAGAPVPVAMPTTPGQPAPMMVPVPYNAQGQPIIVQTQPVNNTPQVVVIKEGPTPESTNRPCYCHGPRQSPCGCCDPNKEYCCIIVVFAYILMSLHYILTILCIWNLCRSGCRYGWC